MAKGTCVHFLQLSEVYATLDSAPDLTPYSMWEHNIRT